MTSSLRSRVALVTGSLVAGAVVVVSAAAVATFDRTERDDLDASLAQRAGEALQLVDRHGGPAAVRDPLLADRQARGVGVGPLGRLVDTGPELLRITDGQHVLAELGTDPGMEVPRVDEPGYTDLADAEGRTWRSFTMVSTQSETAVQAAAPLDPLTTRVRSLRAQAAVIGALAVILGAATTWWLTGIALRPLADLRATAERVAATRDLSQRAPVSSDVPTEVAAVASALDAMLQRLESATTDTEAALEAARQFAADAGHELRTPLTGMGTNIDALIRNPDLDPRERETTLTALAAEQQRLVARLDALQALARADLAASEGEVVDLAEIAEATAAAALAQAPNAQVTVTGDLSVVVRGSPGGLRAALDNLVGNAVAHGASTVGVTVSRGESVATLIVDDDGPGIPADERERVLAPFVRGRHARREGSGLGLAVVAGVVRAHNGRVSLDDSPAGGLRVRLEVPCHRHLTVDSGPSAGPPVGVGSGPTKGAKHG